MALFPSCLQPLPSQNNSLFNIVSVLTSVHFEIIANHLSPLGPNKKIDGKLVAKSGFG
jgi:hypothetical protein